MLYQKRLLSAATLASAMITGVIVTAGSASATTSGPATIAPAAHVSPADTVIIDPDGREHRRPDYNSHNSREVVSKTSNVTKTTVHSGGKGPTAVNAAGGPKGEASQYVDQSARDTSQHPHYIDRSKQVRHIVSNSHNSMHRPY
ncbi:MAG TPA: hypothetical protein VFE65_16570 [Pseudonocardia sp.]|jgi:hypothetical protein|nr:hypothetical protein [Pseudonocardia sp.]